MIEGLPDLSLNQNSNTIGIISGWKLSLVGGIELQGKKDHIISLMKTIIPYARYCISNSRKCFTDENGFVSITPKEDKHEILLRSSQEANEPLLITLDDAEFSDLVKCLDSLRLDKRVNIDWAVPIDLPLEKRDFSRSLTPIYGLLIPLAGISLALLTSIVYLIIPPPQEEFVRNKPDLPKSSNLY